MKIETINSLAGVGQQKNQRQQATKQKDYNKNYEARKAVKLYLGQLLTTKKKLPSMVTATELKRLDTYAQDVYQRLGNQQITPMEMVEQLKLYKMFTSDQLELLELLSTSDQAQIYANKNQPFKVRYQQLENIVRRRLFQSDILEYENYDNVQYYATDIIASCLEELHTNDIDRITATLINKHIKRHIRHLQALNGDYGAKDGNYTIAQPVNGKTVHELKKQVVTSTQERAYNGEQLAVTKEMLEQINSELLSAGYESLESIIHYIVNSNNNQLRQQLIAGLQTFTSKHTGYNVDLQNIHVIRRLLAGEQY